ncbi:hypothetical protein [Rhodopirellula sp. MGV]|uniref:hypothetical protein n=1 Tax=Rhodopirellula sp. MGV TaxID=2023130 RepID=UPI001E3C0FDB|nr:hypothetical protein [Rhodopirellula sp. MGV]
MFTSLVVAGMIATAVSLSTSRWKSLAGDADRQAALRLAESELQRAVEQLSQDSYWRESALGGQFNGWISAEVFSGRADSRTGFVVEDPDGDFLDDPFDEVLLTGIGQLGNASAAVRVRLRSAQSPARFLKFGVTIQNDLQIDSAVLSCERDIQVGDDCIGSSDAMVVTPRLSCGGDIGLSVRGTINSDALDDGTHDVVRWFASQATEIPLAMLPYRDSERAINHALLSAQDNPYGPVNEQGIYHIDAQGTQLTIAASRIQGTLVITNSQRIRITDAICWESQNAALITDSPVLFDAVGPLLDEAVCGTNFNPSSTPYGAGYQNSTLSDRYSTVFRGVFYSTNNAYVLATSNRETLAITGSLNVNGLYLWADLAIRSFDEVLANVPLGLSDPNRLEIAPGSYYRTVTPPTQ